MKKTKKLFRSVIAVLVAVLMLTATAPAVAVAAQTNSSQSTNIATLGENLIKSLYEFILGIINFFKNGFGFGSSDEDVTPPEGEDASYITSAEQLAEAIAAGGKVYVFTDVVFAEGESIVIPEGVKVDLYLQGKTITNAVSGAAAIVNNGSLTINGDGAVVNGTSKVSGSHTVENYGTLVINGGSIGTFDTAGAAVINSGYATINGGTFASKQGNNASDALGAYLFVNEAGTMVINDATVNGRTQGLFNVNKGSVIVNGGTYVMDSGAGVASVDAEGTLLLAGGFIHAENLVNDRYLQVNKDGIKYNDLAVATDNITCLGTSLYYNGTLLDYNEAANWTFGGGTLALKDLSIVAAEGNALTITGNTKLIVEGKVSLIGAKGGSGIKVAEGVILNITGDGSLTAAGNACQEYEASGNYRNTTDSSFDKTGGSGISAANAVVYIDGLNELVAEGYGVNGYGIGGSGATVTIVNTTVKSARGGFVNTTGRCNDEKYNKSEPEGGPAIGGKKITIADSAIVSAVGGSKAAGIGARYHEATEIIIRNSVIDKVTGGASSAAIGGSRLSSNCINENITITIGDSVITAIGGYFGAGIGSGYDTHCTVTEKAPMTAIYIRGNSVINATGGKYAAGIGTGYHVANLTGEIETSVKVVAVSGEKFYKDTYTQAQNIGFGVTDPAREGLNNTSTFIYNGIAHGIPAVG